MVTGVNDGDKSLVVADSTIISVAERECRDVVPLYYEMHKAPASIITPESLYAGMQTAWTCGGIGMYSNSITKIWADVNPDVDAVKILRWRITTRLMRRKHYIF